MALVMDVMPFLHDALQEDSRWGDYVKTWWRATGERKEELDAQLQDIIKDVDFESPDLDEDLECAFNEYEKTHKLVFQTYDEERKLLRNIQVLENVIKVSDDLYDAMTYDDLCDIDFLHTDGVKHCYECVFFKSRDEGCMLQKVLGLAHEIRNVYDEKIKNNLN
jgi:hypothetical protein